MISERISIPAPDGPMDTYVARRDDRPRPAVIMLEGVYGFDDELRRITDLVAGSGYVGIAIDYLRGRDPRSHFVTEEVCRDVAAARDAANAMPYVKHGKIATWGFGYGGTAAFLASTIAGIGAGIIFYGQSIAKPLPGMATSPIDDLIGEIRTPLLLMFGGHDELIPPGDVERIREKLSAANKKFEIDVYDEVGHSFFREDLGTIATRQIADAWDRTQSFLRRNLA